MRLLFLTIAAITLNFSELRAQPVPTGLPPDLNALRSSGYVMGPGDATNPVHSSWQTLIPVMSRVDVYDGLVDQIQTVLCSSDRNKGVLIIGEPSDTYKYIFARLATKRPTAPCANLWHVEIDINKIEAGHKYVGEVEQYWEDFVRKPTANRDVVTYFRSLGRLIGLGSHSNDSTGIESEYASQITAGEMRTVAFISKYEYNQFLFSENAYVLNSFGLKVNIEPLSTPQLDQVIQAYLAVHAPGMTLSANEAAYLYRLTNYYQPNKEEPGRSLEVILGLIRKFGAGNLVEKKEDYVWETPHPYAGASNLTQTIDFPNAKEISMVFESFETETTYDYLSVIDGKTNAELDRLSGNLGAFTSRSYPTNKLLLKFVSDADGNKAGFKIKMLNLKVATQNAHGLTREELRDAFFKLIQVPQWMVTRDFTIINQLGAKIDADVVGVTDAKQDLVRLAKVGYVTGRTDEKPIATVLLAGPTGTGKSYIAKKFAEFTGFKLITIDMTSFRTPESMDRFLDIMANNLTLYPFAVYLFEEIDKASREVLDRLYFMMDEGVFYDKYQKPLFARGAFMLMTTNAGAEVILKERTNPNLRKLVNQELQKVFRDSFLNRFDAVSLFFPFTDAEFLQLAKTLVNKKIQKMKEMFEYTVTIDTGTMDYIATKGRSSLYGARPMERLVESVLGYALAEYQLQKGALLPGASASIKKLPADDHFSVTVGSETVEIVIDPNSNGGTMQNKDLQKFFDSIRLY